MYANGACVYMLCFQYRTDCLQHLPLTSTWMVHVFTCFALSTGQVEQFSKSLTIQARDYVFYMGCIWASSKSQVLLCSSHLWFACGDQDKLILIYVSICSHHRPGCWGEVAVALLCCVNVYLHSRLLRSHSVHGSIFMLAQLSGYCFCWWSLSPLQVSMGVQGGGGGGGVKQVDFTLGNLYRVLQFVLVPCSYMYTRWFHPVKDAVGSVAFQPQQGHLVQDGPRKKMHGNTAQLFQFSFNSPPREDFHYMQVIAACNLHAFLSVQQKLRSL